jgi:hypothetical protein
VIVLPRLFIAEAVVRRIIGAIRFRVELGIRMRWGVNRGLGWGDRAILKASLVGRGIEVVFEGWWIARELAATIHKHIPVKPLIRSHTSPPARPRSAHGPHSPPIRS